MMETTNYLFPDDGADGEGGASDIEFTLLPSDARLHIRVITDIGYSDVILSQPDAVVLRNLLHGLYSYR